MATNNEQTQQQQLRQLKKGIQKCLDRKRDWLQYFFDSNKNKTIIHTLGNLDNPQIIQKINEVKKRACIKLAFVIKIINNVFKELNLTKRFRMRLSSTEARLLLKDLRNSESFSDYESLLIRICSQYPAITIKSYIIGSDVFGQVQRGYTLKVSDNINLNEIDVNPIMNYMSKYRTLKNDHKTLLHELNKNVRTNFHTKYPFGKSISLNGSQSIILNDIQYNIATGTETPQIIVSLYFDANVPQRVVRNFSQNCSFIDNPFKYNMIDPYGFFHRGHSVDVVWENNILSKLNGLLGENVFQSQSKQKNQEAVERKSIEK